MYPYFIFNGVNSTDYLIVNTLPVIVKAQRDIEKIEVQGRDGFMAQDLGSHRGIVKSVECTVSSLDNIGFICDWLDGSGDVIFSNEPDMVYRATIINQIDFSKILYEYRSLIIQFECQPHKYSTSNDVITLNSPSTILNPGTVTSNPIIKIYAVGDMTLYIGNKSIVVKNISDYITVDSELMDCYKDSELANSNMYGDFPVLTTGESSISWAGLVFKIEIIPNWRWI